MNRRRSLAGALLALGLALPLSAAPSTQDADAELNRLVGDVLGLARCTTAPIDLAAAQPGAPCAIELPLDGLPATLLLEPAGARSDLYQLLAQVEGGALKRFAPGVVREFRGTVAEMPGSVVAASLLPEGLFATIIRPDGDRDWIEPVGNRIPEAPRGLHVLYASSDVLPHDGVCGVRDDLFAGAGAQIDLLAEGGLAPAGAGFCAELACDADFQYFQDYGSVGAVENRINAIINAMNAQYESQVDITHQITTIIVRTSSGSNPYTTNDAGDLLDQFRSHWQANHGGVPRDVAHLFTGRELIGSTIGIAWVSAVCSGLAYGLVQSDFNGSFSCATDLSAHELGHNWGADHCSCPSHTMNPGITCANQFNASQTVPDIVGYRNSISGCLDDCGGGSGGYCDAGVSSQNAEHIANVQLAGISNPTGSNGYSDYTGFAITVEQTEAYPLTITLGSGSSADIGGVWVDWNDDEDFDDALETITTSLSGSGPYVANLVVPGGGTLGTHRMRIRIQNGGLNPTLSSCGNATIGEVEDYSIDVIVDQPDPPANDLCANAITVGEGAFAFDTINAGTDGPAEQLACNFFGYTHVESDVWFRYVATCDGIATISVCAADYDTKLAAYGSACPTGPGQGILGCNDDFCDLQSIVFIETTQGSSYLVRIGGFEGATGSGTLSISCEPSAPPCPADLDGSGDVGFNDLVTMLSSWGPCAGACAADLDGSGDVGFADLVTLLSSWGPCG